MHLQTIPPALLAAGFLRRPKPAEKAVDDVLRTFTAGLKPPYDLVDALLHALTAFSLLYPAQGYYAYASEAPERPLQLRVTRTATGTPQVGPNYAGLVAGGPVRQAPLELPERPEAVACEIDGPPGEPYLSLQCGGRVVLRASVARGATIGEDTRVRLTAFADRLQPLFALLLHISEVQRKAGTAVLEAASQRHAVELALQVDRVLALVCRLGSESLGAQAGYLWTIRADREPQLLWRTGKADDLLLALSPHSLLETFPQMELALWRAPQIPQAVSDLGYQSLTVAVSRGQHDTAVAVFGTVELLEPTPTLRDVLLRLIGGMDHSLGGRSTVETMAATYLDSLTAVVDLLDAADPYNQAHSDRVAATSEEIAQELGLAPDDVRSAHLAGKLHDLGMAAIALDIPQTHGTLSEDNRNLIREHPDFGAGLLRGLPEWLVPQRVVEAVRQHHERVDGLGYPLGLAADEIGLLGRVVAVAETFVAHTSDRSYRRGLTPERALFEIRLPRWGLPSLRPEGSCCFMGPGRTAG